MRTLRLITCLLILVTLGCAKGATDFVMHAAPRKLVVPIETHKEIRKILDRPESASSKLKALEPYVKIGDTSEDVEGRLGDAHDLDGYGPGFLDFKYNYPELSGLILSFYPDGILYAIGYWTLDEKETASRGYSCYTVTPLGGLDHVSWPRGKEEETYLFGQPAHAAEDRCCAEHWAGA